MKDIVINQTQTGKWVVTDELGTWPVSVRFQFNAWSICNHYTDGPARVSLELKVEVRGTTYELGVDIVNGQSSGKIAYIYNGGDKVTQLVIPSDHPAIKLFYKKGRGDSGKVETITVDHSFNRQRYGVRVE